MPKKVLIIEDIPINLNLFSILFKKNGYEVQGAENGKEGLRLAKVMSFDLIVCDLKLPGMEGGQIVNLLKSEDRLKDVPIITISANNLDEMKVDQSLIEAHLAKPVQPGILMNKVKSIVPPEENDALALSRQKIADLEKRVEERKSSGIKVVDGFPVEQISTDTLEAGMIIGDEIKDNYNLPVFPIGVVITEKHIDKLKSLNIKEIYIRK